MSAQTPPGWFDPDDRSQGICRTTMGQRARVYDCVGQPCQTRWRWVVCSNATGRQLGQGTRPTRYQAAEVASAVMAAIGAQK